jgi:hypothetical protein
MYDIHLLMSIIVIVVAVMVIVVNRYAEKGKLFDECITIPY